MRRTWSVVIRGGYAASEEECGSARRSAPGLEGGGHCGVAVGRLLDGLSIESGEPAPDVRRRPSTSIDLLRQGSAPRSST